MVAFSSALVFDGRQSAPYEEEAAKAPLSVYGRSKAEAEDGILALDARALIVRTAAFFSAQDPYNFASALVRACREERPFAAADNVFVSPTHTPELVNAALDVAPHDPDFRKIVAGVLVRIEDFFLACVRAGQSDGTISRSLEAEDIARHLLGVLMGVRVLARVRPERTLLEGIVTTALAMLGPAGDKASFGSRQDGSS